jgi:hypothetical protein
MTRRKTVSMTLSSISQPHMKTDQHLLVTSEARQLSNVDRNHSLM